VVGPYRLPNMPELTLRPVAPTDFDDLRRSFANWGDQFEFFGFRAANSLEQSYASNGCLSDDDGMLVIDVGGDPIGQVHWFPAHYGPQSASKALRLGIALIPEARGKGYGSAAQRLLAEYLFATTNVNRLEAGTDLENIAEQRALERAGFEREGVARQSQYRDGRYRDMVIFSRLRDGK
jgi:RimJ/RimL family protein N-acetyltransferase